MSAVADEHDTEAPRPDYAAAGRHGAHVSWANTEDRPKRTAPARARFEQRFLDAANGDPVRAAELRKEHFADLARKSAQARRRHRETPREENALAAWLLEQITEDERSGNVTSRRLVECVVKRRIVELHTWPHGASGSCAEDSALTLRLLALPYTDREGYLDEWRP